MQNRLIVLVLWAGAVDSFACAFLHCFFLDLQTEKLYNLGVVRGREMTSNTNRRRGCSRFSLSSGLKLLSPRTRGIL